MKKLSLLTLLVISLTACEGVNNGINTAFETANSVLDTTGSILGTNSSSTRTHRQGKVSSIPIPDKVTKDYEIKNWVIYQKPAIRQANHVMYTFSNEFYNKSNRNIYLDITIPLYDAKGFECGQLSFSTGAKAGDKSKTVDASASSSPMDEYPAECKLNMSKMKILDVGKWVNK